MFLIWFLQEFDVTVFKGSELLVLFLAGYRELETH